MTISSRMRGQTLAAIDIGSNAVRLYVARLYGRTLIPLVDRREPLRLGRDSFRRREISAASLERLCVCLNEFREIAWHHGALHIRAVATSALRDARNREQVRMAIWQRTGLSLHLIHGLDEARLLYRAVAEAMALPEQPGVLLDLGGGSLEIALTRGRSLQNALSLQIGTVRLLERVGMDQSYQAYARMVRRELGRLAEHDEVFHRLIAGDLLIGTGGSMRALLRLAGSHSHSSKTAPSLNLHQLEALTEQLFSLKCSERQREFHLKRDRADVIRPASVVVLEFMRHFNFAKVSVPNVGVKNGVFWELADQVRSTLSTLRKETRWQSRQSAAGFPKRERDLHL